LVNSVLLLCTMYQLPSTFTSFFQFMSTLTKSFQFFSTLIDFGQFLSILPTSFNSANYYQSPSKFFIKKSSIIYISYQHPPIFFNLNQLLPIIPQKETTSTYFYDVSLPTSPIYQFLFTNEKTGPHLVLKIPLNFCFELEDTPRL